MKTRVIPAQVTTVEDKIAGNLNFTQILLLIASVLINMGIYVILPQPMKFALYKVPLIIFIFILFGVLTLRIKDRVLVNWIALLASYSFRPHIYIFNKNNTYLRDIDVPTFVKKVEAKKVFSKNKEQEKVANDNIDYITLSRSRNLNIKLNKSGILATKNL